MKKKVTRIVAVIFVAILMICCILLMCGCGNKVINPFDLGSFNYTVIHEVHSKTDLKITGWYEHDNGIEVILETGEHAWYTEGTYILFEKCDDNGRCPLCAKDQHELTMGIKK